MSVLIQIELPDDVYLALVPQADRCDTQVHKLIEAAVTKSARRVTPAPKASRPKPEARNPRTELEERVAELNAQGQADGAIALQLNLSASNVHRIRHDVLGLPARGTRGRPRKAAAV